MRLQEQDFADSFGIKVNELPDECKEIINNVDFSYYVLEGEEKEKAILDELKRIDGDTQVIAAPKRTEVWEKGWNENLVAFRGSNWDLEALIPKFYRKDIPLRLNQKFIKSSNERFEYDFFRVFRMWLFKTYFSEVDNIYEFGCGTGYNLVEMAELYPDKNMTGFDFVPSVIELLEEIHIHKKKNITGAFFDMVHPDFSVAIKPNSAIYTFGAIEQLGGQINKLFEFFLEKEPVICVHMEPVVELYDEDSLIDYLAKKFHRKRGYTEGLLPLIQKLQEEKKAEILKVKRLYLGNYNMEGYNLIVWKPGNSDGK